MKIQCKLVNYFDPTEKRRMEKRDLLKAIWKREREHFIPSCNNCKRRYECLILKHGTSSEQFKCLKKRAFLSYKFGYELFNVKPNSIGFELGIKEFFKQAKEIERVEQYWEKENSLEQAKLTNYLQGG